MSNEMHPDLKWLAENVSEWKSGQDYLSKRLDSDGMLFETVSNANYEQHFDMYGKRFTYDQWLQARKDTGLIATESEEELPAEDWAGKITDTPEEAAMVEDMVNGGFKQLRYQDANGEDWIDEFARTATVDEFRGAMRFTIGKYNRRAGKKDELIKEIDKMRDYCDRWLAYEKERL